MKEVGQFITQIREKMSKNKNKSINFENFEWCIRYDQNKHIKFVLGIKDFIKTSSYPTIKNTKIILYSNSNYSNRWKIKHKKRMSGFYTNFFIYIFSFI